MHTNDFPATSIGRSSGSRLHLHAHTASTHEAHAHPLLSPGRPSSPTPSERSLSTTPSGGASTLGPQKYIPYTPRQRVTPTTTTVHPSAVAVAVAPQLQHGSHHGAGGDATSKLQLMHLKAAAQGIGLDSGTLGWSMLERLVLDGEREEEGWTEVWSAITSGKATLLLPLESSAHTHDKITADFLKDHIVLCDGPSRKNASIVTLSGLRGILEDETLTFRSTLSTHSKLFHDLLSPSTRTTALGLLPSLPLPIPPSESSTTSSSLSAATTITIPSTTPYATSTYPHFTIPSYSSSLPLPPRSSQAPNAKPPLPPRPAKHLATGSTSSTSTSTASTASRIPNPFASLFGGSSSSSNNNNNNTSNNKSTAPTPVPPSPPTSLRSLDTATSVSDHTNAVVEVSAFTIDRRIVRKDVAKEVNKALKNEIKASLASVSLPSPPPPSAKGSVSPNTNTTTSIPVPGWVVERVHDLSKEWYPFVRKPSSSSGLNSPLRKAHSHSTSASTSASASNSTGSGKEASDEKGWVVNTFEEDPEDVAQRLQDFYFNLEQDMRAGGTPFISRRKERERKDKERKDKEDREKEKEKEGKQREEEKNGEKEGSGAGVEDDKDKDKEREKRISERLEAESRIREVTETVERTLTSLFYDRLFMQPTTTDDASHDEALSNRIAALNMLDLGLGHLGIQVGGGSEGEDGDGDGDEDEETEVDVVVKACGEMLSQLDTCRSPADKAAVLVAAHKVVVDGLSRLPPIRLISENDNDNDATDNRQGRQEEEEEDGLKTAKPTSSTFADAASSSRSQLTTKKADDTSNAVSSSGSATDAVASEANTAVLEEAIAETSDSSSKPKAPLPPDTPTPSTQPQPHPRPQLSPISNRKKDPTPVSGDVLLPLIIFSVVKSNPPHLVSNLLFTQRFRNQSVGGEESYCLINLMAVAEFLENVDMAGLGLGEVDKVVSTADLTPIPLTRSPVTAETPLEPTDGLPGSLRGRVGQQVDAIADSANKVISGVVDSSFGILRSFMPVADPTKSPALSNSGRITPSAGGTPGSLPKGSGSGGFGLLRRESGFSIASLAASLPVSIPGRARSSVGGAGTGEEAGQQLVTVSRPSSVKSFKLRSGKSLRVKVEGSGDEEEEDDEDEESESVDEYERDRDRDGESEEGSNVSGDEEDEDEDESNAEDGDGEEYVPGGSAGAGQGDTRSIRSFESMLSASRQRKGRGGENKSKMSKARKSLSDRLASVSALAGRKTSPPPTSRRSSLLQLRPTPGSPPASSRAASPSQIPLSALRLPPPKQRFMECTPDDLRLSEVGELLREYRRLVEDVRAVGGFDE